LAGILTFFFLDRLPVLNSGIVVKKLAKITAAGTVLDFHKIPY